MGKRSGGFARRERDFYPTPVAAVKPLIPHLPERFKYIEPCCGDGALVRALSSFEGVAHDGRFCPTLEYASDISAPEPLIKRYRFDIAGRFDQLPRDGYGTPSGGLHAYIQDAFNIESAAEDVDLFVTNPPWDRKILHRLIVHLIEIRPTWLLFDADWMHTKQAAPYLRYCRKIVSVGRVKWFPDSPHTGKDNCAWYLFDYGVSLTPPEFWGRGGAFGIAERSAGEVCCV